MGGIAAREYRVVEIITATNFTGTISGPTLPFTARCLNCGETVVQGHGSIDVGAIDHECASNDETHEYEITWTAAEAEEQQRA